MSDTTTGPINTKESLYALLRFIFTLAVLTVLSISDLRAAEETIPTAVYIIIGGMNGVDAYKLYQSVKVGK